MLSSAEDTGLVLSTQRVDNNSLSLKFRESNTLFSFLQALWYIHVARAHTHTHTDYMYVHTHTCRKNSNTQNISLTEQKSKQKPKHKTKTYPKIM